MLNQLRRLFCMGEKKKKPIAIWDQTFDTASEAFEMQVYKFGSLNVRILNDQTMQLQVAQLQEELKAAKEEKEKLFREWIKKEEECKELRDKPAQIDMETKVIKGKLCVIVSVKTATIIEKLIFSPIGVKIDHPPYIHWVSVPACDICLAGFGGIKSANPPLALSCGHCICFNCSLKLIKSTEEFNNEIVQYLQCPFCRNEMILDSRLINAIPKNFAIMKIVDSMTLPDTD